jgi:hypothetical protein
LVALNHFTVPLKRSAILIHSILELYSLDLDAQTRHTLLEREAQKLDIAVRIWIVMRQKQRYHVFFEVSRRVEAGGKAINPLRTGYNR